ncbi:hypothetical protein V2J09_015060 [Rumex salicifolius]
MSILRRLASSFSFTNRRFFSASAAAAVRPDAAWTPAPLKLVTRATKSLFHVTIDVADAPELAESYTRAGQYVQLRVPNTSRAAFYAIASPPSHAAANGEFEFLLKTFAGSTAELICGLRSGDSVELSPVLGHGFDVDRISPAEEFPSVLIFATGSGISPIRSLIESGFGADKRSDVRLYYGARNLKRMAYQDRFEDWESSGIRIVPVLSHPDDRWTGETGFVQAAFYRAKGILHPSRTGIVLCGRKQMTEEVTRIMVEEGVSSDRILKNF